MSEAAKKGTSLAVETEPGVGSRPGYALAWVTPWPAVGAGREAVSLAFDLEDDHFFDLEQAPPRARDTPLPPRHPLSRADRLIFGMAYSTLGRAHGR